MKKTIRDELLSELEEIKIQGIKFFDNAFTDIDGRTFTSDSFGRYEFKKNVFWDLLQESNQNHAKEITKRIVSKTPIVSECARLTHYLSQMDQIEIGHAIKGMRAALNLRKYRFWGPEILHDEGHVLGVEPGGQSVDEAVCSIDAQTIFLECYDQLLGIVELLNPITLETAKDNLIYTGQSR
jgi:hypothetical protein